MATKTRLIFEGDNRTQAAFAQINGSLAGLRGSIFRSVGALKGLVVALGVIKGVRFGAEIVEWQDEVAKMARGLSQPIEEFSALAGAAEFSGVSLQTLRTSARTLITNLARGETATIDFRDAMADLGLEVNDLSRLSLENQLAIIAARMGEVEDGTRRTANLTGLFGARAGVQFGNLVADVEQYAAAVQRARDAGFVISEEEGARAERTIDKVTELGAKARRTAVSAFNAIGGAVDAVTGTTSEAQDRTDALAASYLTLASNVRGVRVAAEDANAELGLPFDLSEFEEEVRGVAEDVRRPVADSIADAIGTGADEGGKAMTESLLRSIRNNFVQQAANLIAGSLGGTGGAFGFLFGGARAAGGPVGTGAAYLVGEKGPELFVPGSSGQIIPNGGGVVVNQTLNVASGVSRAEFVGAAAALREQTKADVFDELRRTGRLRG